jgi:hypothetical protein
MRNFLTIIAVVFMSSTHVAQAQPVTVDPESIVPLPDKFDIELPAPDVPPEIARFHGAWIGTWGDDNRHVLVVERIRPDGHANVVFAHADSAYYNMYREWFRSEATIADGVLTFHATFPVASVTLRFVFDGPDRLYETATYRPEGVRSGILVRTDLARLATRSTDRMAGAWRARVHSTPDGPDAGWRTADYARSNGVPAGRVRSGAACDRQPRGRRRPEPAQDVVSFDRGALASRQGICRAGVDAPRTRQVRGNQW